MSSGLKTFHENKCKDMQVNLSCTDNDVGNYFVHCDIGLMTDRKYTCTSFDVSRATLFKQWFGYHVLDI